MAHWSPYVHAVVFFELQASVKGSSTRSSFSQTLKSDTKLIFVSLFAKGHFIAISIQRTLLKHQLLYFLKLLRKCVIRFKIISLLGNRPVNFVYYVAQFDSDHLFCSKLFRRQLMKLTFWWCSAGNKLILSWTEVNKTFRFWYTTIGQKSMINDMNTSLWIPSVLTDFIRAYRITLQL